MTDERFAEKHDATGFTISGATIDSPTDVSTYYYCIDAPILGYWVFDARSGTILGKFDSTGNPLSGTSSN
jgi:hypothetical protein